MGVKSEFLRVFTILMILPLLVFFLIGCQAINRVSIVSSASFDSSTLTGSVHAGEQPVSGTRIQLYAVGNHGPGSEATPLLKDAVITDSKGSFTLPAYSCPSGDPIVYLNGQGGDPGGGVSNSALSLITLLGPCSSLISIPHITMNELTTVASVYALAPYMTSATTVGSVYGDTGIMDAPTEANQLVDMVSGVTPGAKLPVGCIVPIARINTLADILGTCVNSIGGVAGDGTRCGQLFSASSRLGKSAATDTVSAAMLIMQHPTTDVASFFRLLPSQPLFTPSLQTAPLDWSLSLVSAEAGSPLKSLPRKAIDVQGSTATHPATVSSPDQWTESTLSTNFPASLEFSTLPQNVFVGATLNPVPVVSLIDGSGNPLMETSCDVSLILRGTKNADLNSVTIAATESGIASFPRLFVNEPGAYTMSATCPPFAPTKSSTFNVVLPTMFISLPTSTVTVGANLFGTASVALPPSAPLTLTLRSSSPAHVSVTQTVTIPSGQDSASFTYAGVAAGPSTLVISAPGYSPVSAEVGAITVQPPATLRQAAAKRGLLVGAAADADEFDYTDPLIAEPLYARTLAAQYNMLEAESAMKWIVQRPSQYAYNFEPGDQLVSFAHGHQMKVRGHNLVWGVANPAWLTTFAKRATTSQMSKTLQTHIATVVGHYVGKVFAWDVVNEAVDDAATGVGTQMKDSIWYNQPGIGLSGTGYVEQAFRWAHAADPNALLFYNDYNIYVPGPKFQAVLNMVTDFVNRGVPINGVGIQMHIGTNGWPDSASLASNIRAFTALGLQVHITEMDVQLPVDSAGAASASDLQTQANTYQRILTVCLQNPSCTAFQTWGFSDAHSWIPSSNSGFGAALPFDSKYRPKPAFRSILNTLVNSQ